MNRIISFGEVLVDMLSSRVKGGDDGDTESFRAFAGGAPANVAVAVAKLGAESWFAGKVGDDYFGRFLKRSLAEHGVNNELTVTSATGKTALAFVSLDETGDRSFSFYGDNAAHLDINAGDIPESAFGDDCIFHFGSNTLTTPTARAACADIVERARSRGALVSLDINFRQGLWAEATEAPTAIADFVRRSHLVKASREELELLWDGAVRDTAETWLAEGVQLVVVTDGPGDIAYFSKHDTGIVKAPSVEAVDTTAAGDAFVGGMLARIAQDGASKPLDWLAEASAILEAVSFGAQCGAYAVTRHGAFTSLPTRAEVQSA
jgi:fructokinase